MFARQTPGLGLGWGRPRALPGGGGSVLGVIGPSSSDSDDGGRRSRLHGIRLRALVAEHLGRDVAAAPEAFPAGAAMVVDGAAWVVVEGSAARLLGRALAWAVRNDADALHLVAGADTGLLARRAGRFTLPIDVWFAEERTLLPAPPEPLPLPPAPLPGHLALTGLIEAAGAAPNVEHGVVFGEVRGLEVCRVVAEPTVGHVTEPGVASPPRDPDRAAAGVLLEVGVGANDREAFQILHGDVPTVEALSRVVAAVAEHRRAEAPQHPLNRLMAERFLRWRVEREPGLIGLRSLTPAEPPLPRPNLKDPTPCVAAGVDEDGREVAVVFSTGVDLDLAAYVADVRAMDERREIAVVTPARDLVPITRELVGLLAAPVRFAPLG